jgi:hypothetical protein
MVSEQQVTIDVLVNTAQAEASLNDLQSRVDDTVQGWRIKRSDIMKGLSEVNQFINIVGRLAARTTDAVGSAILKIIQSFLATVNATFSLAIATAAMYTSTGVLAGVGAALAAFAAGYSIGQTAAIIQTQGAMITKFAEIRSRLSSLEQRNVFTGWHGGGA